MEPATETKSKKRAEKVDHHREFLDMDTDEEEFGRQETPETEEEIAPEPDKPIFSDTELITLVQYVKDLTSLSPMKQSCWTESTLEIIREYFRNPFHTILCIFYDGTLPVATLNLPNYAPSGFTYFLRSYWQIYTTENFLSSVHFGSINEDTGNCVLKFMENIFAPIAIRSEGWPQIVRDDLFSIMNEFLMCLTNKIYKPLGLTVLYVPREGFTEIYELNLSEKEASHKSNNDEVCISNGKDPSKQEFVGRLEMVVRSWIKQVREVLANIFVREAVMSIPDELEHWHAIYSDLNSLQRQVCSPEVQAIASKLKDACSPSIKSFETLITQVEEHLTQAASNLSYLNILSQQCGTINVLDEERESVMKTLFLIVFVWAESPYYNQSSNVEVLCQAFSTQIIRQCTDCIDLEIVLDTDPEHGIVMLKNCIKYCENYKKIYDSVVVYIVPHLYPNKTWQISKHKVFNHVDTFIRRCHDLIDICDVLMVFGKSNKVGIIGNTRGVEHELYCRKIEHVFHENLEVIKVIQRKVLNETDATWVRIIHEFRNAMTELESMIANLIFDIFDNVTNVEEGIEAIFGLQKFNRCESLHEMLKKKWTEVWRLFDKEVKDCSIDAVNEMELCHVSDECRVEAVTLLSTKSQYLKRQYDIMINASDWIGSSDIEGDILEQYARTMNAIELKKLEVGKP